METTNEETIFEEQVILTMTERADEVLHMILDLKQDKEVNLHRLQTLVLNMYRDEVKLVHMVEELERGLDSKSRKILEIPKFMAKREAQ